MGRPRVLTCQPRILHPANSVSVASDTYTLCILFILLHSPPQAAPGAGMSRAQITKLCGGVWYYVPLCPSGIYVDLEFLAQILSTETPHSSPSIFQSIYNSRPNALKQPPFYRCPSAVSTGGKILSIGHQNS